MWRLLIDEGPAHWQMALDEALLVLKSREKIPNTIRLYVIKPSAVTIGYFQKISESVNLSYTREKRIPVVRRVTGGGAVLHDQDGEITYSVTVSSKDVPENVLESYKVICSGVIEALSIFGLQAEFVPVNDVLVRGKKISGSAQARRSEAVLQHGTLMYNTNLEILARALMVPKAKLVDHGVRSITERVTTISTSLGRKVDKDEVIESLKRGFEKALGITLEKGELTEEEIKLAKKLERKYISKEWNFRR
ncbi:MAG: lipoate--protein ligase family protein [Thermoproteota archaeon]|nr:MAG: lipoate--protein ligase family protein [Candidatus Korarchaeota archaeon]